MARPRGFRYPRRDEWTLIVIGILLALASGCTTSGPPPPARATQVPSPVETRTALIESPSAAPGATSRTPTPPSPSPAATPARPSPEGGLSTPPAVTALVRGHGIVRSVDPSRLVIVIEHEEIPDAGLGPAVTRFTARSYEVVTDVHAGEEVDFDLARTPGGTFEVVDAVPMGR